ncbi:hypothetical protein FRB99_000752 [Tulasnella sp. 403]|nr:hypothetical protein FRB99_000752 [Tulasnella sp. 403]
MNLLFPLLLLSPAIAQITPQQVYQPPDLSAGYASSLPATAQWSNLLGNLLWFYEAQRSGKLPANNRVSWRNDSALDDGDMYGVDLTGGYYDAGDYIKATHPLAWTIFSICWGANAHPSPNTLYVQVGDTDIDNNYWGGDEGIPGPRLAWQVNATVHGTDVTARTAAAFASCSALYNGFSLAPSTSKPAQLANSTYAATLLTHASQLYSLAQQKPYNTYAKVLGAGPAEAYPSSSYNDDLALAGVMMSVAAQAASGNSAASSISLNSAQSYLDTATSLYDSAGLQMSNQDVVLNWDSVTPVLPVLLTQVSLLNTGNLQPNGGADRWRSEAEVYLDRIIGGKGSGFITGGGLLFYNGDSDPNSLNPAMNAAQLMFMYAPMATSSDKTSTYQSFARRQWDYALGQNPMNMPYVVGVNPNSPTKPHDAKSAGGNNSSSIDTNPVDSVHILYGAAVGGPDKQGRYFNIRSDWPESEVALDYNAPFMTLAAYSVLNINDAPFYNTLAPGSYAAVAPSGTPCDPVFPCNSNGSHGLSQTAKIVIGVVVACAVLLIVLLVLFYFRYWRRVKPTNAHMY